MGAGYTPAGSWKTFCLSAPRPDADKRRLLKRVKRKADHQHKVDSAVFASTRRALEERGVSPTPSQEDDFNDL